MMIPISGLRGLIFCGIDRRNGKSSRCQKHPLYSILRSIEKKWCGILLSQMRRLESIFPLNLHRRILNQLKPDIIIVHGVHFPLQVLLLHRSNKYTKIVIQHHSERPLRHVKGFLQRFVDRFTSAYFFPSVEQAIPGWKKARLDR
jgi:hypothetical protein